MANSFKIRYLWELFPDTDFIEENIVCEELVEKHPSSDNQITEAKWEDIRDSTSRNRLIQSVVIRDYEVKFIVSRNVTPAILGYAEYITVTTTDSETFQIYDVQITYNKIVESRDYVVELTFKRADNNIVSHLSSDNVLSYKTATSTAVNEISYTVDKAPFSSIADFVIVSGKYGFEHTDTTGELWDAISQGDILYLHTNEPKIVEATWYSVECTAKIPFANGQNVYEFETTTAGATTPRTNVQYVLDYEPGAVEDGNVNSISLPVVIYTFIDPLYDNIIIPTEGITSEDALQENQKINTKNTARFKVWLKTSELWKIEYINYLQDISDDKLKLTLSDTTEIFPVQVKDIYKRKENRALIGLYEYDIEVLYNNKVVSIYR